MSPSSIVQRGPARTRVKSTTRSPASGRSGLGGSVIAALSAPFPLEAKPHAERRKPWQRSSVLARRPGAVGGGIVGEGRLDGPRVLPVENVDHIEIEEPPS